MALLTLTPADNMSSISNFELYDSTFNMYHMIEDFSTLDPLKWNTYINGSIIGIEDDALKVETIGANWNNGVTSVDSYPIGRAEDVGTYINFRAKRSTITSAAGFGLKITNTDATLTGLYGFYLSAGNIRGTQNGGSTASTVYYDADTYDNYRYYYASTNTINLYKNEELVRVIVDNRSEGYFHVNSLSLITYMDSISHHYPNGQFSLNSSGDTKIDVGDGFYLDLSTFTINSTNLDITEVKFYSSNDPTDPLEGDYTTFTDWASFIATPDTYHRYYWLKISTDLSSNDFAYITNLTVNYETLDVTPPTDVSESTSSSRSENDKYDYTINFTGGTTGDVGSEYAGANLEIELGGISYFQYADGSFNTVEDFSLLNLVGEDSARASITILQQDALPTRFRLNTFDAAENKNSSDWFEFTAPIPDVSVLDEIATVTKSESRYQNIMLFRQADTDAWGFLGSRYGNGDIDFSGRLPNGSYETRVMSIGSPGVVSDSVAFVINNPVTLYPYPDPNWDRWVFASICEHFDGRRGTIPMYVEGQHRDTKDEQDFFELRVDGPWLTEISRDQWKLYVEINVLCQAAKDNQDFHTLRKMTGLITQIFERCIKIYKYGTNVWDDQSHFCSLTRIDDKRGKERIQVSHFGQIEPRVELEQASIEAHYSAIISV